jgi:hypothetical protein
VPLTRVSVWIVAVVATLSPVPSPATQGALSGQWDAEFVRPLALPSGLMRDSVAHGHLCFSPYPTARAVLFDYDSTRIASDSGSYDFPLTLLGMPAEPNGQLERFFRGRPAFGTPVGLRRDSLAIVLAPEQEYYVQLRGVLRGDTLKGEWFLGAMYQEARGQVLMVRSAAQCPAA